MSKKTQNERNFVAKHMRTTCRSARHKDKKNDYSRKDKHKGSTKDPFLMVA